MKRRIQKPVPPPNVNVRESDGTALIVVLLFVFLVVFWFSIFKACAS